MRQVMQSHFGDPKTWNQWEDLSNSVERGDVEVINVVHTRAWGTTEEGNDV